MVVTGGAGFVGSHLVDRLMLLGHEVTVLDNFFTGSRTTVSDLAVISEIGLIVIGLPLGRSPQLRDGPTRCCRAFPHRGRP
jgi:hypothetical protein